MSRPEVVELLASIDDKPPEKFVGRFAWALHELIEAGAKGCTPIDRPAPRWSHYVHRLRRDGVAIETVEEKHGGPFSGRHGRYRLSSNVQVVKTIRQGEGRSDAAA